jgi:hypothetical protein
MREAKGEGLLRGPNGRLQSRKLAAWISFDTGIALLARGAFLPPSESVGARVVPAIVGLGFSLLFWGLVTVQNVVQLVALLKGQDAEPSRSANELFGAREGGDGH